MLVIRRHGALPSTVKNIFFLNWLVHWLVIGFLKLWSMYAIKLTDITTWEGERHGSKAAKALAGDLNHYMSLSTEENDQTEMPKKLNLTMTFNFQTCQWRALTEGRREGLVAGGKIQVHAWFKISHFLEDLTITFCLVAFKQMEKTAMMLKISLRDFWFRGLGIHDGGGWWKDLYPYPSSAFWTLQYDICV